MPYQIDFEPTGRRGQCLEGQTLLACARQLGVDLVSLCGGAGTCGRCKIQVLDGRVSPPTLNDEALLTAEELATGYRLACNTSPLGDCKIRVPAESLTAPQRTQIEGQAVSVIPDPLVRVHTVTMPAPTLTDLRSDAGRLADALRKETGQPAFTFDLALLQGLSPQLRERDWHVHVALRGDEVIGLIPDPGRGLGLAVDLGTTKIAGYLVDLASGRTIAARGVMNPQIAYGEDVIARIGLASRSPADAAHLQKIVGDELNRLVLEMCAEAGSEPAAVVDAVIVANTAMHHLLLRLPVQQLALAPYVPAIQAALDVKAREIGLRLAAGAYVHLLPNIAGFVGADHVAMVLATGVHQVEGVVLALDIGTNTEVCLANHGTLTSLSCASGPAFEGAHIRHGMRAAPGAIEHVRLVGDEVECQTIGDEPAVGICGSGILDALAQLWLAGLVGRHGRLTDGRPNMRGQGKEREFVLAPADAGTGRPAITITQNDIQELLLAKGAIRSGIDALLAAQNLDANAIEQVIIAGAFGSYIDISSASAIGMLPALPLKRFRQVGNAAGMGAKMALLSRAKREEATALAARIRYIELTTVPGFSTLFARSLSLGRGVTAVGG